MSDAAELSQRALAGRYELERELARSATRVEFLARDLRDGRAVSVHLVPDELARSLDSEAFLRELRRAAELRHPRIAPLEDLGRDGGRLFAVGPRVEGVSVRTWLGRERALPFLESVRVLREVAEALVHAHARGVTHRELAPESVLWVDTHVVLPAFGWGAAIAAARGGSAREPRREPEPLEDGARSTGDGERADIYALGALGYEILTGHAPTSGALAADLIPARMEREDAIGAGESRLKPVNALREHMPPGLAYLVMRCLRPNPRERWASASDASRLLEGMVTPNLEYRAAHFVAQGRYLLRQEGAGLARALERFESALAIDPRSTRAHAAVADACCALALHGYGRPEALRARARTAAERALELASASERADNASEPADLASAHVALARTHATFTWDWRAAREHAERALALAPNDAKARALRSELFLYVERDLPAAIDEARRAVEADPSGAASARTLSRALLAAGRTAEAVEHAARAVEQLPSWSQLRHLGLALCAHGRHADALTTLERALAASQRHPWTLYALARALAASGEPERASPLLDELLARSADANADPRVQPALLAQAFAALGRLEESLAWLSRAAAERDPALLELRASPAQFARERVLDTDPRARRFWRELSLA